VLFIINNVTLRANPAICHQVFSPLKSSSHDRVFDAVWPMFINARSHDLSAVSTAQIRV
jgi:hypothetical protein